jgi:PAS domain S-box-containing protein
MVCPPKTHTIGNGPGETSSPNDVAPAGSQSGEDNPVQSDPRLLNTMLTSSLTAVGVTDAQGRLLFANDALIEMWGYCRDDRVLGRNLADFWVQEGIEEFTRSLIASDQAIGEGLGRRKDGTLFNAQYSADLIRDDDGRPLYMFGTFLDITDQKNTLKALRRSEATFNGLFRAAPIGIGLVTNRVLRFVNRGLCEMSGYSSEELIGKSARILYESDEEFERVGRVKTEAFAERGTGSVEARCRHKDGTSVDVLVSSAPIQRDDLSAGVIFTAMDISDRKRAERALQESEERYRLLFERNLAGVWRSTLDGHVLECNAAMARILGYRSPEEAIQESTLERHADVEDGRRFTSLLSELGSLVNYEFDAKKRDGTPVSLLLNASLVPSDSAEGTVVEGTAYDITEHKTTEQQLRQALKMEAVGQLAGGIAHDFNNLLMAVTSYTDLLEVRLGPNHSFDRYTDGIRETVDRATGLVRKILAFGRKQMLQPKVVNLNTVVDEMERMLRRTIPENIRLETCFEPRLHSVKADPSQIEQVIVNLAINARDAMPAGGSLTISTENVEVSEEMAEVFPGLTPDSYVVLSVADVGKGMSEETVSHIFEPFFTTKSPGQGTGLGLAQVWGIVKQSEGYIYVDSDPGVGTTFRIYLPTVDDVDPAPSESQTRSPTVGGTETVLVAEDDNDVRSAIREGLVGLGYEVFEATDGDHALQIAAERDGHINALVTDMVMPGIAVDDLVDRLTKNHPALRVVYITGYSVSALEIGDLEGPTSALLQKPFSLHDLAATLRRLLDGEG